jgi:hypothetical protein
MTLEEQEQAEEQPLHGHDDDDRDDALVHIQDAIRQISVRVESLAAPRRAAAGAARGRARPATPFVGVRDFLGKV